MIPLYRLHSFWEYRRFFSVSIGSPRVSARRAHGIARKKTAQEDILYGVFFHSPLNVVQQLEKFVRENNLPMNDMEYRVVRWIKRNSKTFPNKHYGVICPMNEPGYLKHEISHYLAERFPQYRKKVMSMIASMSFFKKRRFLNRVTREGYYEEKFEEINARILEKDPDMIQAGSEEFFEAFDKIFWKYYEKAGLRNREIREELQSV